MSERDWRQEGILKFARKMMVNCDPCPDGCGAMVCGDVQKKTHKQFHNVLATTQDDRVVFKNRLDTLEAKLKAAQQQLTTFMDQTSGKDTEQDARLLSAETRLATLESNQPAGGII